MNENMKSLAEERSSLLKPGLNAAFPRHSISAQMRRPNMAGPLATGAMQDDLSSLKDAASVIQRISQSARHELELARRLRADAQRYQLETATKARSDAQQLILHARLATQKEIEELIRKASEEIQKVLADIRVIRITAQEELAAQRKFTDAARLSAMSMSIKQDNRKSEIKELKELKEIKKKKQLAAAK